jgi:steroid delta-isomerase-like uncharacterized protein
MLTTMPINTSPAISLPTIVQRYLLAWNEHNVNEILATLAADGTYEDPTTQGPLGGADLEQHLTGFFAAFPDVTFEVTSVCGGDDCLAVNWLMRGTNAGPLQPDLPPTGASIALPGVDLFHLDGDIIRSVQGFFDQKTFLEQLGLQVMVQPWEFGPVKFGRAVWLSSGRQTKPAAFSTTWVDVPDEAQAVEVVQRTRQMFSALLEMPGFIGATFTRVGNRLATQTAWDTAESAHAMRKLADHKEAVQRAFGGDLGTAFQTSVWVVEHQNPLWVRCGVCDRLESYETGGRSVCGEPFPEQPSYW